MSAIGNIVVQRYAHAYAMQFDGQKVRVQLLINAQVLFSAARSCHWHQWERQYWGSCWYFWAS